MSRAASKKKPARRPAKKARFSLWSNMSGKAKMLVVAALVGICGTVAILASHAGTGLRIAIIGDATGKGYWVAASDGGVFTVGDATFYGSKGATALPAPIVGMATTNDKKGYWLVDSLGNVYNFGDAAFEGSLPKNFPTAGVRDIVGITADPATSGYWLVGADGGVFNFGAPLEGSLGGKIPAKNVVGITADLSGGGYWLVGADGGVFALGNAPFLGSLGGKALAAPISGMTREAGTNNYWLVGKDGGVFSFGAPFYGSTSGIKLAGPVMGIASSPTGKGYWLIGDDGGVFTFGDALFQGTPPQVNPTTVTTGTTLANPTCSNLTTSVSGKTVTINGLGVVANSAPYINTVINWGDGSAQPTVANATGQSHSYGYGTFTISVVPHFTVNGGNFAASSTSCQHVVAFSPPPPPPSSSGGSGSGGSGSSIGAVATFNCNNATTPAEVDACTGSDSTSSSVSCNNIANAFERHDCQVNSSPSTSSCDSTCQYFQNLSQLSKQAQQLDSAANSEYQKFLGCGVSCSEADWRNTQSLVNQEKNVAATLDYLTGNTKLVNSLNLDFLNTYGSGF